LVAATIRRARRLVADHFVAHPLVALTPFIIEQAGSNGGGKMAGNQTPGDEMAGGITADDYMYVCMYVNTRMY